MTDAGTRDLTRPDTLALFGNGRAEIVQLGPAEYTRYTLDPGFRWSTNNLVMNGGALCKGRHTGFVLSGRFGYTTADGQELEAGPGQAYWCPPGHDKWTIGDEPCVLLEIAVVAS